MKVKLSIVILSWNTKELLQRCLDSILGGCKGARVQGCKDIDVIVVDNGSTDESVDYINGLTRLRINGLAIKKILNKENLGFSKGNNIGIKEAKGEYIMLLNPDTIVQPGAMKVIVDFLEGNDPYRTAVSPLLVLPSSRPQIDYYMKSPNLWQVFLYHNPVLRPMAMKIPLLGSLIAQKGHDKPFEVDQLPGAALMAHRSVWDKVGLLDEDYHFLFEDVDWCWKAKKLGIKLIVVPEAKIVHLGGASWKQKVTKDSVKFYYQFFSSMLLFVRKNYSPPRANIFKWAVIINFFLTFKPKLAWKFFRKNGRQEEFLK